MKRLLPSLFVTVLIFTIIYFSRGELSSAFADITVKMHGNSGSEMRGEAVGKVSPENSSYTQIFDENIKLKKLLGVKEKMKMSTVAANVVSFGNNEDYRYFIVDRGVSDGVYPGGCVISDNGFVGVVTECGETWCGVKTLESHDTELSVTCVGNGKTYLLSGGNLKFVSHGDDVMPGDMIVTSGLSDKIPGGIKVGRVYKSERGVEAEREVIVSSFEKYKNLRFVLICTGRDQN